MVPGQDAHDLNNLDRLTAAIRRINTAYDDADLVVFAGDLADRSRTQAYAQFREVLEDLRPPYALTVGNHDNRAVFLKVLGQRHADSTGFVQSAHDAGAYRVIVLDTLKAQPGGAPVDSTGVLCDARLDWARTQLALAQDRPVVVVLHHPPLAVGISGDPMSLQDPTPLIDAMVAHGDVRHVVSGHVHMTTTSWHRGIPFTTIAGGFSSSVEDFGRLTGKFRRSGPAQMAVLLGSADQLTVHFDNYHDDHAILVRE